MTTEPIRILQIVSSMGQGNGVLCVIKNWHRYMDRSKVQFDYLYFQHTDITCQEEIEKMGGKIYQLSNPLHQPLKFLRETYRFFKTHRYKTIHSHLTNLNFFFYPLAKMFGTKNIIQHAHATKWGSKKLSGLRNYLMLHAVWGFITHKIACSRDAANAYFGKKSLVINNGIDTEKFAYSPEIRTQKRKELGLENNFLIGHIGRFSPEKNHKFLLDVFEAVSAKEPAARLVLVGNGPLEKEIQNVALQKGLQDKVVFLGVRKDVNELYQIFDVFVFPSLQEGFGLVAVEAQAAGLPCILADTLPEEVRICNCQVLALKDAQLWADKIVALKTTARSDCAHKIKEAGFSARDIALSIQKFYLELEK